jgi:phage major head subunit gpT-like protein
MAPDYGFTRLQAASQEWSAVFYRNLEIAESKLVYPRIAQRLPMRGTTMHIEWIGQVPSMAQWVGDRPCESVAGQGFDLNSVLYTTPRTRIPRTVADDDQLGQFDSLPAAHAAAAMQHREQLVAQLLIAGIATNCYDGTPWLGNAHQDEAEAAQTNYQAGAGSDLSVTNVLAGFSAMGQFYGSKGRPLGMTPTHLIYGPANFARATTVFDSEFVSDGTTTVSNPTPSVLQPLYMPFLGTSTMWFLVDLSKGVYPVLLGIRDEPEIQMPQGPEAESVFLRDQYEIACRARHGVAPGLWQTIYGFDGTP